MEITVAADSKEQLSNHSLYKNFKSLKDVQLFMESHVFAVWDFMSLLKTLQNKLTCTQIPWVPIGTPATRFFINEIVLGEESDVDPEGQYISHFELYLKAMRKAGASTKKIDDFIQLLHQGKNVEEALTKSEAPAEAQQFVLFTFEQIENREIHELAALFTYGREDLIPTMFISMIESLNKEHRNLGTFLYYLQRHVELDGDHHGQLSLQMTQSLINGEEQKQKDVELIIEAGYRQRIQLWNGIQSRMCAER